MKMVRPRKARKTGRGGRMANEKRRRVKFKYRTVYRSDLRFQTNPVSGKGIAKTTRNGNGFYLPADRLKVFHKITNGLKGRFAAMLGIQ